MDQIPPDSAKRLLFVLHRGLTEIRDLALAAGQEQIADLADALEILPGMVECWEDDHWAMARFVLRNYQEKHPETRYDHLAHLEQYEPAERF